LNKILIFAVLNGIIYVVLIQRRIIRFFLINLNMNFIDFVKELINNGEVEDSTLENITTLDSSDAVILNTLRSSENKLNEQVAKYISGVGFFDASETKKSEKTSKKISESKRARSSISRGTINKNLKSENKLKENEELDRD